MKWLLKIRIVFLFFVVLFTFSTACNTKIKKILNDPEKYHQKKVKVKGKVVGSVDFGYVRSFSIKDKTGIITIITREPIPYTGELYIVKGTVNMNFVLMKRKMLIIDEKKKKRYYDD